MSDVVKELHHMVNLLHHPLHHMHLAEDGARSLPGRSLNEINDPPQPPFNDRSTTMLGLPKQAERG